MTDAALTEALDALRNVKTYMENRGAVTTLCPTTRAVHARVLRAIRAAELADTPPPASPGASARAICEFLGFDPTNHHNAARCPYCTGGA